jgi:hypothetical protein
MLGSRKVFAIKDSPSESLRRELARLGVPAERHAARDLVAMLPVRGESAPIANDADALAEVLIYLLRKNLIEIPSVLEAGLELQWGAQLCQFYRSQDELLELVAPFFKRGLHDQELCIWIVTPPLTPETARAALEQVLPSFGAQVWFHEHEDYAAPEAWRHAEQRALDQDYRGLRVAGDTRLLGAIGDAEMVLPNYDATYVKQQDRWVRIPS